MFTPPPSPLPRAMLPTEAGDDASAPFLLPPPASSPMRSPSPTRSLFFPSSPSSSSATSSPTTSPESPAHHDRSPFFANAAVQASERRTKALALSLAPPPAAVQALKKAQGRRLRLLALAVPVVLVLLTLFAQHWRHHIQFDHTTSATIVKRDDDSSSSLSLSTSASSTASSTAVPTSTELPIAPAVGATVPVPTPFPQPFDSSLSANFTSNSCKDFFTSFTTSTTFRPCRSFGLLFANSRAFFQAQANYTLMNSILWGTCNTKIDADTCTQTMTDLATQLKTTACKDDLKAGNAIAVAALVGFSNYALYRQAACIVNPRSNSYCYLEALASSDATDLYTYSLPLGISLPADVTPTCSKCSQAVLGVMHDYASNGTLPVSKTYPETQNRTATTCGEDFAAPAVVTNGAPNIVAFPAALFVAVVLATAWVV